MISKKNNIHLQFLDICASLYKETVPQIRRTDYTHRSLAYSTTLLFLKHITVAKTLTKHLEDVDQDTSAGKHTAVTLLRKACYSKRYIEILVQGEIRRHTRLAQDILEMIPKELRQYATI